MLIKKDVYDKKGVLLIAKGNVIDDQSSTMAKLRYLGLFNLVEAQDAIDNLVVNAIQAEGDSSVLESTDISLPSLVEKGDFEKTLGFKHLKEAIEPFEEKFSKFDDNAFRQAISIVDSIIYDCKNQLWYPHFSTLSHYTSWTYSHSINTALISCMIGIGLKYSHKELVELTTGAILHDLGMMLIPKSILLKEGALAPYERLLINGHCDLGNAMVAETGLSQAVRDIILQHHERIDGTGYPNALTGAQMSDYAKIVSVACFFDSATSYRPYKETKTSNQVLQEMEDGSHQYENKVVKALRNYLYE